MYLVALVLTIYIYSITTATFFAGKIVGCWDGEIVSTEEDEKEKGEVRNPANGKGDMGNSIAAFFIVPIFSQLFYSIDMLSN